MWNLKLVTCTQKSKCFTMWFLFLLTQLIETNRSVHQLALKVKVLLNSRCTWNLLFYFIIVIYLNLNYSRSCWQHFITGTVFQEFMTQWFEFTLEQNSAQNCQPVFNLLSKKKKKKRIKWVRYFKHKLYRNK